MRSTASTVLELAGLALTVVGVAMFSPAVAVIVAGVGLTAVGYALGAPGK